MGTWDRRAFVGGFGSLVSAGMVKPSAAMPAVAPLLAVPATEMMRQPQEICSRGGVLRTTITAAAGAVDLGQNRSLAGSLYNGAYLPPVLRAQTGDVLKIRFRNRLSDHASNLHFHGLGVSPRDNSDNVF